MERRGEGLKKSSGDAQANALKPVSQKNDNNYNNKRSNCVAFLLSVWELFFYKSAISSALYSSTSPLFYCLDPIRASSFVDEDTYVFVWRVML